MCQEYCGNDDDESWEDSVDDEIARLDSVTSACAGSAAMTEASVWTIQERLDRIERSLLRVMAVMLDPSTDLTALARQFVSHGTARGVTTHGALAPEIWRMDRG